MSRNVRTKFPLTPVKGTKKRRASSSSSSSSSLDLSDDEGGYSGVEAISDSEDDDDEDVIAAEEEQWFANELKQPDSQPQSSPPRPVDADEEGDDEDDPDTSDDEQDDDDAADESGSWEGFGSDGNAQNGHEKATAAGNASDTTSTVERRVRFDVPDSDGDTTESDDGVGFFPDIFVDQSTLDPSFRREIEMDGQDSDQSGGFWDIHGPPDAANPMSGFPEGDFDFFFEDDSTPAATPMTHPETSTAVSTPMASPEKLYDDSDSLDGYQSDGDTTEDEEIPERRERIPQRRPRPQGYEEVSDSDAVTLIKPRRGRPRVGCFKLDSNAKKPVAVVNPRTGKLMIFTPQRLRRMDLSPETFNFPFWEPVGQDSPLLGNSGNLMMGAMFSSNTFGDFMNTQAVGPVEAFFNTEDQTAIEEESSEDAAEGDEEEHRLNVDDFLDLGNASSDDEGGNDDEAGDPFSPTPTRTAPTNTVSGSFQDMLSYFENNSGVVGAFRRDQANSQLIRNGKATRESLAFSSPFFEGTLRGVKDGRLTETNVPISPLRKQKKMSHMASSPLAPVSQKRKSTAEQHNGHKRQRSIPELDSLHLN